MTGWLQHLPVLPVLLPLFGAALLLLPRETRRRSRAGIALIATVAQLAVAVTLLALADGRLPSAWAGGIAVYALGGWPPPFGIVLVVDRLAAAMLVLTAALALATLVYSLARWERAGSHFLPLFQFLLMGLNGTFLTGDLFNLFVFFEVMLAASYGLMLHGSGKARVKAGLHYIVVNLVASFIFLIAAALIYGVTGSLNMAELAQRAAQLGAHERALFDLAAALLAIVFLVKAAAWPLNFWLPGAYGAAAPPVAGVFAILTKVGVYALLRFATLPHEAGVPPPFGGTWLFYTGLVTVAAGTVGVLASQRLPRVAAFLVIVSSGTLLAAFGFAGTSLTAPALYYLVSSVLASGAFFMVIEMAERDRTATADLLAVSLESFGLEDKDISAHPDEMAGVVIPAAMAFLGLAFFSCVLLLTGLPPFSGFVGKLALLAAAIAASPEASVLHGALFGAALLLSGIAGVIALSRLGIRVFWDAERTTPRLHWVEAAPVAALVLLCAVLAFGAGPAMDYFNATARSLHDAQAYAGAVLPVAVPGAVE